MARGVLSGANTVPVEGLFDPVFERIRKATSRQTGGVSLGKSDIESGGVTLPYRPACARSVGSGLRPCRSAARQVLIAHSATACPFSLRLERSVEHGGCGRARSSVVARRGSEVEEVRQSSLEPNRMAPHGRRPERREESLHVHADHFATPDQDLLFTTGDCRSNVAQRSGSIPRSYAGIVFPYLPPLPVRAC
jgi:hypothetical protein